VRASSNILSEFTRYRGSKLGRVDETAPLSFAPVQTKQDVGVFTSDCSGKQRTHKFGGLVFCIAIFW